MPQFAASTLVAQWVARHRYQILDGPTGQWFPRVAGGSEDAPTLAELVTQAEGDLAALTPGQLADLRTALATAYAEARANITSDEQVEALTVVAAAISTVDAEVTARAEAEETRAAEEAAAAEARAARLAELDATVVATSTEPDEGDDGEGTDTEDATDTPDVTVTVEAEVVEPEPELAAASAAPRGRRPNLATLVRSQPTPAPATDHEDGSLRLRGRIVASASAGVVTQGQAFSDAEQLGRVIADRSTELAVPDPTQTKHYLARLQVPPAPTWVQQPPANVAYDDRSLLDEAVRRNREANLDDSRRVASGGVCVVAQPDYTITTVGDRGAAWVDGLPTITGPRPISFYRWINMSLTATAGSRVGARPDGGIGTVTAAQDLAGYGGGGGQHALKDCVRIDCPTPVTEAPEAQFRCTTVGNFAAITWAEYVRVFDETVGFYFDVYRDEQALAKFVAFAKNLSSEASTFGAARDLLDKIRRLVAQVRSVRKAPTMAFTVAVPGFAKYMIAQDLADSLSEQGSGSWVSANQALARLAIDEGIMLTEYNVSIGATANGNPTVLPELADGQALPDWLDQIRILVYPEGGVVRHNYGELAFGLRETGMATNDFSGFYETFESLLFRTTDLFTLDVALCVNGALGATVEKVCDLGS